MKKLYAYCCILLSAGFLSCSSESEPSAEKQLATIILRHTTFDISPFPFTIAKDSTRMHGGLSLSYTCECTLQFDSVTFDSLKHAVRTTKYFNSIDLHDNVFLRSTWEAKAPDATHGVWNISTDGYWFDKRYDEKGVDIPHEALVIHLDTIQSTIEITYLDFTRNLIHL